MKTFDNILELTKAFLVPVVLVLLACDNLYQSHEQGIARSAQRLVSNLPTYSQESEEWVKWSALQLGYADPEKFLLHWNAKK